MLRFNIFERPFRLKGRFFLSRYEIITKKTATTCSEVVAVLAILRSYNVVISWRKLLTKSISTPTRLAILASSKSVEMIRFVAKIWSF